MNSQDFESSLNMKVNKPAFNAEINKYSNTVFRAEYLQRINDNLSVRSFKLDQRERFIEQREQDFVAYCQNNQGFSGNSHAPRQNNQGVGFAQGFGGNSYAPHSHSKRYNGAVSGRGRGRGRGRGQYYNNNNNGRDRGRGRGRGRGLDQNNNNGNYQNDAQRSAPASSTFASPTTPDYSPTTPTYSPKTPTYSPKSPTHVPLPPSPTEFSLNETPNCASSPCSPSTIQGNPSEDF
jgi:hypothetical protein